MHNSDIDKKVSLLNEENVKILIMLMMKGFDNVSISAVEIKNFKSIRSVNLEIRPITILCGANSCGKSSVLKSLLFQKQIHDECKSKDDCIPYNGRYVKLGNFNTVRTRNEKEMTLSISIPFDEIAQLLEFPTSRYQRYQNNDPTRKKRFKKTFGGGNVEYRISFGGQSGDIVSYAIILHKCKSERDTEEHSIIVKPNNPGYGIWQYSVVGLSQLIEFFSADNFRPQTRRHINKYSSNPSDANMDDWNQSGNWEILFSSGRLVAKEDRYSNNAPKKNLIDEDYDAYLNDKQRIRNAYRAMFNFFSEYPGHFFNKLIYLGPLREEPTRLYLYDDIIRNVGIKGENAPEIYIRNQSSMGECRFSISEQICEKSINFAFEKIGREVSLKERLDNCCDVLGIGHFSYDNSTLKCGDDNITDVGFGISQIFPILLQSLIMRQGDCLLLEQPEIHLHPAMQMKIADFFVAEALAGKNYIIETHSDHIINRLVRRIVEDGLTDTRLGIEDLIQIYFVERGKNGQADFRPIEIDSIMGIVNWPVGFFDQSANECREIMRASAQKIRREQNHHE